ncbi:3-oxoacid CoA-transferase subunit A [Solimonas aquatica]|uniref:3-oxoacid CoA-transferase subunit A n=1 Tax=Solimonas aquatica TaxID=489703 RepID=A0A1H9BBZ9_9GAMM|nr:CoA transferase subunit A [Solimonas aquatica]SEP86542.1 3-oxoacid CoA-transferase subunit A [Solimonas aquatica]
MSTKLYASAAQALAGLCRDGMTVAAGGFGLCGVPLDLIVALRDSQARNLTVIGNNVGCDEHGMWLVLANGQIRKVILSYAGDNKILERAFMNQEIEIEFNPQGTLAERLRAGGAGIPAFFTRTGYGTLIAEGKEARQFANPDGSSDWYIMETGLTADVSLVKAWKADAAGNLVYRKTARNFNPMIAAAGRITIAEVEELVPVGEIDPDQVHTPGIFVDRIVVSTRQPKHIERPTTRPRTAGEPV